MKEIIKASWASQNWWQRVIFVLAFPLFLFVVWIRGLGEEGKEDGK